MDVKKRQELLIRHGEAKKGTDVYYRDSWECFYFSLLGKCFGMMGDTLITLKGYPEENELLRKRYTDITPGYYANKMHWNSIKLDTEQLTDEEIMQFIDLSYQLVYEKLSKKDKATVDEMHTMD